METVVEKSIAVMIATVRKQPNVLTAMTHIQFFHATAQHGKRKGDSDDQRSLTFFESRKIVEEQLSAPGNSYASITKGAGVHVKCVDAQTQTDKTYNIQLKSTASGCDPPPKPGQKAGGDLPPAHQTNAGGRPRPAPKASTSLFEKNKDGAAAGSTRPKRADHLCMACDRLFQNKVLLCSVFE